MGDNLHTLAHAQFGRWACENPNDYTCNNTHVSVDVTGSSCWDKLKGYTHTSAHAPIGSWGAVHLSVHAQSESCRNIGVRRCDENQMNECANSEQRAIGWSQSSCATPECLQSPWQQVQGGVVGWVDELGHGPRTCTHLCLASVSLLSSKSVCLIVRQ